jgi:hypothetical protein
MDKRGRARMKTYVEHVCQQCAEQGAVIATARILHPARYREGALVMPLDYEPDEFSGMWFVQFGLAVNERFIIRRLDLGQARFRFSDADDVAYPGAIRRDEAEVKRGDLIEVLDERFGPNGVNIAARTKDEAMKICNRLWPREPPGGG